MSEDHGESEIEDSEMQDLRTEYREAMVNVQILKDRVNQLEFEKISLVQTVQENENVKEQDRDNIRATFEKNLNDKDSYF